MEEVKSETPQHTSPPFHEVVGGSSVRQYLNQHLTQHVLDGFKKIAHEKPEDPLRALGEFLIERSEGRGESGMGEGQANGVKEEDRSG